MKVAITGSRGFIGSHLKTRLEKDGHEIIEWDLKQDPPKCIKDFDISDYYKKEINRIKSNLNKIYKQELDTWFKKLVIKNGITNY